MYIILVYDIGEKRVGKMLKRFCRQYVNWKFSNSVFEGEYQRSKNKQSIKRTYFQSFKDNEKRGTGQPDYL
jgi:CRISPR-associated protein Cas2